MNDEVVYTGQTTLIKSQNVLRTEGDSYVVTVSNN